MKHSLNTVTAKNSTSMLEFQGPDSSGSFVQVSILPTGWLYLPDTWIFADGKPSLKHWSPDFSFLIRNPSGKNVLFDLGMRKVRFLPQIQDYEQHQLTI